MKHEQDENLTHLLADRAIQGLSEEEMLKFTTGQGEFWNSEDLSLELAATALFLSDLEIDEPLPAHLETKILTSAQEFIAKPEETEKPDNVVSINTKTKLSLVPKNEPSPENIEEHKPAAVVEFPASRIRRRAFSDNVMTWAGWAAAAACLILAFVILNYPKKPTETVNVEPPKPKVLTVAEQREELLKNSSDALKVDWTEPNPKAAKGIAGDVVWSNSQQKGFLHLHGIPRNDVARETYQLWIGDANQDPKTPTDGGIFDVTQEGDVFIPINAKLKIGKPTFFAVTKEKPGGVVVSTQGEKLILVAKI